MKYFNINILQFQGIPRNSMELTRSSMEILGIQWNFSRSKGRFHGIPWNNTSFMQLDTNTKFHAIPQNSMESADLQKLYVIRRNFRSSMELGSITNFPYDIENYMKIQWNSMELLTIDINRFHNWRSVFHCFMISCDCISDNPLAVERLRYHSYKATFGAPHLA